MSRIQHMPNRLLASLRRPWSRLGLIMALSLGGLLLALAVAGMFALAINRNIEALATDSLDEHNQLEEFGERGEEVRIAVIEIRHDHETLIDDPGENLEIRKSFQESYSRLVQEIDMLEAIGHVEPEAPSPAELRAKALQYYATFWPALMIFKQGSPELAYADRTGMAILLELEGDTELVDRIDERRAAIALASVRSTNAQERVILLSVLGGIGLACAALGFLAFRVVGQMRALYEAEQSAATQLTNALSARTVFIADASHELRTPLTVLKGNAELGLVMDSNCSHVEILQEIVHESDRMTRLVENLLFLARSDAAAVPLKLETFPAQTLADDIATRAEVLVHEHGGKFAAKLLSHGPITADQGQIEQAVMILVDNAAKYGPPGGIVRFTASTSHDELVIEVTDEGPGIPAAALPHLFERFTRVDKARSRSLGGSGLGLAIAKTIVEAHKGKLEVESQVNQGTRMRIRLPTNGSPRSLQPSESESSAARSDSIALGPQRTI